MQTDECDPKPAMLEAMFDWSWKSTDALTAEFGGKRCTPEGLSVEVRAVIVKVDSDSETVLVRWWARVHAEQMSCPSELINDWISARRNGVSRYGSLDEAKLQVEQKLSALVEALLPRVRAALAVDVP